MAKSKLDKMREACLREITLESAQAFSDAYSRSADKNKESEVNLNLIVQIIEHFQESTVEDERKLCTAVRDKFLSMSQAKLETLLSNKFENFPPDLLLTLRLSKRVGVNRKLRDSAKSLLGKPDAEIDIIRKLFINVLVEVYDVAPKFEKHSQAGLAGYFGRGGDNKLPELEALLVEYMTSIAFEAQEYGGKNKFCLYLDLLMTFEKWKKVVVESISDLLVGDDCKNPKFCVEWLVKYHHDDDSLDQVVTLLNKYHDQFKDDELQRFAYARVKLSKSRRDLASRVEQQLYNSRIDSFESAKQLIAGYDQAAQADKIASDLDRGLGAVAGFIKANEDATQLAYLIKLNETHYRAFRHLEDLGAHFSSSSSKKYKGLKKTIDDHRQELLKATKSGSPEQYNQYLLMIAHAAIGRKNFALARRHFAEACHRGEEEAYASYAVMCYRGVGGAVKISDAYQFANRCAFTQVSSQDFLSFGEIFHVMIISTADPAEQARLKTKAEEYYKAVCAGDNLDDDMKECARMNLRILSQPVPRQPSAERQVLKSEAYYREYPHNFELLTEYVLLMRQREKDSERIQQVKTMLKKLFPELDIGNVEVCYEFLSDKETKDSCYFDADASDDSDDEDASRYDKHTEIHFKKRLPFKLEQKVRDVVKTTGQLLKKLEEHVGGDLTELEKSVTGAFVANLPKFYFKDGTIPQEAKDDAAAYSHGVEADKEGDEQRGFASKLAATERNTEYYLTAVRGIRFDVSRWSLADRRRYRTHVKSGIIQQQRVYCSAAYIQAGVGYQDITPEAQRRLSLAEKYIHYRMERLSEDPYKESELPSAGAAFTDKDVEAIKSQMLPSLKFKTKREQIQQLYSNRYDLFHRFIAWESEHGSKVFPSAGSPFISTGDYGSIAPFEYAIGNKVYQGFERERLRPRYNKDGKPTRPYSGSVTLSLLRIQDLLQTHNSVIAMNSDAHVEIALRILPERETSFVGSLPGEIIFAYQAKFPDFSVGYSPAFYLKYGLTKALFDGFKRLLSKLDNHSDKQRLLIRLLGRHLSAFHAFYLQNEAFEVVRERKGILFFRNPHGGFRLYPADNKEINPTPNDDRAKTQNTHLTRSQAGMFGVADESGAAAAGEPSQSSSRSEKRRRVDGEASQETSSSGVTADGEVDGVPTAPISPREVRRREKRPANDAANGEDKRLRFSPGSSGFFPPSSSAETSASKAHDSTHQYNS